MVDDVLRMRATVVSDQALAELRKIGRELGIVGQRGAPGIKQVNTEFARLGNTIRTLGGELKSAIPALGGFGLGAAGIGLAVGQLMRTMSEASKRVVELKYASKELGMSERDLRAWQGAAEKAGISAQSMMAGMEAFKKTTDGLKYNIGGARDELYAMGAGPIVQRMMAATTQAEKMKVAFDFKEALQKTDPTGFKARMFFDQIGLGADKARLSLDQYERAQAKLKPLSPEDQERAQKFADSLVDLGQAWDQLVIRGGVKLFPWLTDVITGMTKLVDLMERAASLLPSFSPVGVLKAVPGPIGGAATALDALRAYGASGGTPGAAAAPAAPGLNFNERFPGSNEFGTPGALRQNQNLLRQRGNSLYQPSAFGDMGGGLSEGSRMVKDGVFAALVEFQSYVQSGGQGGGGGGFTPASFGGSAGAAAGGGAGGRAPGAARFGGGGYSNLTPGTGGGTSGGQSPTYDPGSGKVIGNTAGGGVPGGSAGGSGGITAPAGTPIARTGLATVTSGSGRKFQVDQRFASNFQGFINDYEKAGGQLGPDTGTLGSRPHNASGHPIGAAIDINQIGRGVRSRAGRGKSLDPAVEDELAAKWGLVSGNRWRSNDQGHFGIKSVEEARQALIRNGVDPATATAQAEQQIGKKASDGGKTVKGSYFGSAPGWPRDPSEPASRPTAGGFKNTIPGIALPADKYGKPSGQMYEVTGPDGKTMILPHIDSGPHKRTGRGIDITAAGAAAMGYTSKTFPTDGGFSYRRVDENIAGNQNLTGNVKVTVNSNGTAAKTSASADGLWQKTTVENYKQMQPTNAPANSVEAGP